MNCKVTAQLILAALTSVPLLACLETPTDPDFRHPDFASVDRSDQFVSTQPDGRAARSDLDTGIRDQTMASSTSLDASLSLDASMPQSMDVGNDRDGAPLLDTSPDWNPPDSPAPFNCANQDIRAFCTWMVACVASQQCADFTTPAAQQELTDDCESGGHEELRLLLCMDQLTCDRLTEQFCD